MRRAGRHERPGHHGSLGRRGRGAYLTQRPQQLPDEQRVAAGGLGCRVDERRVGCASQRVPGQPADRRGCERGRGTNCVRAPVAKPSSRSCSTPGSAVRAATAPATGRSSEAPPRLASGPARTWQALNATRGWLPVALGKQEGPRRWRGPCEGWPGCASAARTTRVDPRYCRSSTITGISRSVLLW